MSVLKTTSHIKRINYASMSCKWEKKRKNNFDSGKKTKPLEMIREAYAAGQRHFGENRMQELARKS